jgi:hypothetical protein
MGYIKGIAIWRTSPWALDPISVSGKRRVGGWTIAIAPFRGFSTHVLHPIKPGSGALRHSVLGFGPISRPLSTPVSVPHIQYRDPRCSRLRFRSKCAGDEIKNVTLQ